MAKKELSDRDGYAGEMYRLTTDRKRKVTPRKPKSVGGEGME